MIQMISGNSNYFWNIITYLGLYSAVTLLIIHRNEPLKKQFIDIFMFFFGIDLFSMFYIFAIYKFKYNVLFCLFWTATGILVAVWGLFATKFRNKGYKGLYIAMLIPLFAMIFLEFAGTVFETWSYLELEYRMAHNMTVLPYAGSSPKNKLSFVLINLLCLIICSVVYIKKKKQNTQIKGTI